MLLRAKVEEAKSQSVELRAEVSSSKAQGQEAVRTLRGQLQQAQAQIEQQGREIVSLTEGKAAAARELEVQQGFLKDAAAAAKGEVLSLREERERGDRALKELQHTLHRKEKELLSEKRLRTELEEEHSRRSSLVSSDSFRGGEGATLQHLNDMAAELRTEASKGGEVNLKGSDSITRRAMEQAKAATRKQRAAALAAQAEAEAGRMEAEKAFADLSAQHAELEEHAREIEAALLDRDTAVSEIEQGRDQMEAKLERTLGGVETLAQGLNEFCRSTLGIEADDAADAPAEPYGDTPRSDGVVNALKVAIRKTKASLKYHDAAMKAKLEAKENTIDDNVELISSLQDRITELEDKVEEGSKDQHLLRSSLDSGALLKLELEGKVQQYEQEVAALAAKVDGLDEVLNERDLQILELEKAALMKEDEIEEAVFDLDAAMKDLDAVRASNEELAESISERDERITGLSARLEESRAEAADLRDSKEADVNGLAAQVTAATVDLEEKEGANARLRRDVAALEDALQESGRAASRAESALEEARLELKGKEGTIAGLQGQVADLDEKLLRAGSDAQVQLQKLKDKEMEIKRLEHEVQSTKSAMGEKIEMLQQETIDLEVVQTQAHTQEKRLLQLATEKHQLEGKVQDLEREVDRLEAERRERETYTEEQISLRAQTNSSLTVQLETAKQALEIRGKQFSSLQEQMKMTLRFGREAAQALEREAGFAGEIMGTAPGAASPLSRQLLARDSTDFSLAVQNNKDLLRASGVAMQARLHAAEQALKKSEAAYQALRAEYESVRAELGEFRSKQDKTSTDFGLAKSELQMTLDTLERMTEANVVLQGDAHARALELEDLRAAVAKYEGENAELREKVQFYEAQQEELAGQVREITRNIHFPNGGAAEGEGVDDVIVYSGPETLQSVQAAVIDPLTNFMQEMHLLRTQASAQRELIRQYQEEVDRNAVLQAEASVQIGSLIEEKAQLQKEKTELEKHSQHLQVQNLSSIDHVAAVERDLEAEISNLTQADRLDLSYQPPPGRKKVSWRTRLLQVPVLLFLPIITVTRIIEPGQANPKNPFRPPAARRRPKLPQLTASLAPPDATPLVGGAG